MHEKLKGVISMMKIEYQLNIFKEEFCEEFTLLSISIVIKILGRGFKFFGIKSCWTLDVFLK
jgi:hypothetical protein